MGQVVLCSGSLNLSTHQVPPVHRYPRVFTRVVLSQSISNNTSVLRTLHGLSDLQMGDGVHAEAGRENGDQNTACFCYELENYLTFLEILYAKDELAGKH